MKRVICVLLLLALCLCACGKTETPAPTEPAKPVEKLVPKPLTWADIDAIPIATADMTEEELRQICIDYFRLQLSFQWTPKEDLIYEITGYRKPAAFPAGTVYAGLPYMNPSHVGNLYVLMEYYDPETGLLDNSGMGQQTFADRIGNNCASGSFWGWARVVNSVINHSCRYATKSFGFLPVGPYTYDDSILDWNPDTPTAAVCRENGEQTMFASYAALKPADGVVVHHGTPGDAHMRMISREVVVAYNPDGSIDGSNSYITFLDQTSNPTATTMDGHPVVVEGGLDRTHTFRSMFNEGYLPFTFAELIGQDPVEPAEVWLKLPKGASSTFNHMRRGTVSSNYTISHLTLTVEDRDGKEVYRNVSYLPEHNLFTTTLFSLMPLAELEPYTGEDYTATIACRVSTGQLLTVWTGNLTE